MINISELTDYNWIYNRIKTTNCHTLVTDYQVAITSADDNATVLHLLKAVFDLTVYILDNDLEQLSSQLYGRLIGYKGYFPQLDALLDQIWNLPKADLLPIHPTMPQIELEGEQHHPRQINRTHTWYVTSIAVGQDVVASAAGDGTLIVWDKKTAQQLHQLEGHTDIVNAVAINGDYLVSASLDTTVKVWNWRTGDVLRTLEGHSHAINTMVINGEYALSAGDGIVIVWNWQTGQKIRSLHTDVSVDYLKTKEDYIIGSGKRMYPNSSRLRRNLVVWNWKNGSKLAEEWQIRSNSLEKVAQKYLGDNLKLFHSEYQLEFTHFSGTFEKRNPYGNAKKYLKSYGVIEVLKESFGVLAKFRDIDHGCFQTVVVDDQMLIGGMLSGQLHFLHIKPPANTL